MSVVEASCLCDNNTSVSTNCDPARSIDSSISHNFEFLYTVYPSFHRKKHLKEKSPKVLTQHDFPPTTNSADKEFLARRDLEFTCHKHHKNLCKHVASSIGQCEMGRRSITIGLLQRYDTAAHAESNMLWGDLSFAR